MENCAICGDPLERDVAIYRCYHYFHTYCVDKWRNLGVEGCLICRDIDYDRDVVYLDDVLEGSAIHWAIEKIGSVQVKIFCKYNLQDLKRRAEISNENALDTPVVKLIYLNRKRGKDLDQIIQQIEQQICRGRRGCWWQPYYREPYLEQIDGRLKGFKSSQRFFYETPLPLIFSLKNLDLSTIPCSLAAFYGIREIDFSKNELLYLPKGLNELERARVFRINDNKLESLSVEVEGLTALEELHMQNNQITELPDEIKKCTRLRFIDLRNNPLTQSLDEIRTLLPENCEILI